jgi:RecB family endonuclease NucS
MFPLFERLSKPSHDAIVSAVNKALELPGWTVEVEPIVGNVRPDLVARGPDGTTHVIEVKQGGLEANLGAVAQVEAFRNAVAEHRGGMAKGMLVVAGEPPEDLDAAAERADVELVYTESAEIGAVRESLKLAGLDESAIT